MKMKKWMALSCAAAMVLSALPVSADEAEVNEEVSGSITVWEHEYSFEEALKAVIEGFKAKYPNVEVDYEIKASDYQQVLATALQSGEGPDLFWTNGTATDILPGYVANGMVEELTDTVDFSIMTDDAMKLATIDGKQYSVPWLLKKQKIFLQKMAGKFPRPSASLKNCWQKSKKQELPRFLRVTVTGAFSLSGSR